MEFEKKEHRPWKTELLESTIMEAVVEESDQNLFVVPQKLQKTDVKTLEAIERAEQAELSLRAAEHGRLAAEDRMREAIEQVYKIDEKVRQLELENKTLEATISELFNKNSQLESDIKKVTAQNQNLEAIIETERSLRVRAEARAKRAINQANHTIMQVINTAEKIKIRMPSDLTNDMPFE